MKITINTDLRLEIQGLESYLRVKFSQAKVGEIIRIKSKKKNDYDYLVLSKRYEYDDIRFHTQKTYQVLNLSSGYLWRAGGETLSESFTEWFTHNDNLTITELDVVDSSELTITSFK